MYIDILHTYINIYIYTYIYIYNTCMYIYIYGQELWPFSTNKKNQTFKIQLSPPTQSWIPARCHGNLFCGFKAQESQGDVGLARHKVSMERRERNVRSASIFDFGIHDDSMNEFLIWCLKCEKSEDVVCEFQFFLMIRPWFNKFP